MTSRRFHLFASGDTRLKNCRLAYGNASNIELGLAGRMSRTKIQAISQMHLTHAGLARYPLSRLPVEKRYFPYLSGHNWLNPAIGGANLKEVICYF
jgi:hypothetical protein